MEKKEDPDFKLYRSCRAGALTTRLATSAYLRKTFAHASLCVTYDYNIGDKGEEKVVLGKLFHRNKAGV